MPLNPQKNCVAFPVTDPEEELDELLEPEDEWLELEEELELDDEWLALDDE